MFLNYPINSLNSTNMEMKKRKGYFTFNKQSFVGRTEGNITDYYIISEIWGSTSDGIAAELPSLRVFMATLRKKLEVDQSHPQYIQTHIGIGYRMIQHNRDSAVSPEA